MMTIPFGQLFETSQYSSVSPGGNVRVFYGKIPNSCVGFVRSFATLVWYPSVMYDIRVDGEGFSKIRREIPLENPMNYQNNDQIVIKDKIEVYALNSSTNTYNLGAMVDGVAYHRESMLAGVSGWLGAKQSI